MRVMRVMRMMRVARRGTRSALAVGLLLLAGRPLWAVPATDGPPTLRIDAPVRVEAAPRSVRVVRVRVPADLRGADSLTFRVTPFGTGRLTSARTGVVPRDRDDVLLTVVVPADAPAGVLPVADVRFERVTSAAVLTDAPEHRIDLAALLETSHVDVASSASVDAVVIVPVEIDVSAVHAVRLSATVSTIHAVAGRGERVLVQVHNAGNVTDTLRLTLSAPVDWSARLDDTRPVVLAPGGTASRTIALSPPRTHRDGTNVLGVRALSSNATREHAQLSLDVALLPSTRATAFGPQLGVTYSAVQQPGAGYADTWGLTLTGPLTRGVDIDATWTQRALAGAPGLARVGGGQLFPTLALRHARWRVDAGNASADFGDLGGLVRSGRGVAASAQDSTRQVSLLFARPFRFDGTTRDAGALAGVRAVWRHDVLEVHTALSHLRDPLLTQGALDALTVGVARTARPRDPRDAESVGGASAWRLAGNVARLLDAWQLDARAAVALRRVETVRSGPTATPARNVTTRRTTLGASAEFTRRTGPNEWRLRATSAPGGSSALARAQHEVTLTGSQQLGATRLGLVGWYAEDVGVIGQRATTALDPTASASTLVRRVSQRVAGVGLLPQWRLGRRGTIGLEARVGQTQSGDSLLAQSVMTQVVGGFAATRLGEVLLTTTATLTRTARSIDGASPLASYAPDRQLTWTTQVMLPTPIGALDAFSSLQRRLGTSAFAAGQHDLVLRLEQVQLPGLPDRVQLSGAVGRIASLAGGGAVITQRLGASVRLPFDTWVRLDVERNPFLRFGATHGWMTALRMERRFGAPAFLRGGRGTGVVFEDRNGNGVRDPGERGLAGVVVRVGGEAVVTDAGGVYRLTRPGAGLAEVDERSLPLGLLVAPRALRAVTSNGLDGAADIPIIPTGDVEVQLVPVADSVAGARGAEGLGDVRVYAVDELGRRHLARVLGADRRQFESLPPGRYRLEVDAAAAAEPLVLQGAPPMVTVDGRAARQLVPLPLGPRRVRLFRGGAVTHVRTSAGTR